MSSLITAVAIITEWREPERDQPDFIVTNIIFLLWCTGEIYIVVFPPTVIPPSYLFFLF